MATTTRQLLTSDRAELVMRRLGEAGWRALSRLRKGRPLDLEPVVRMLGMRPFARRFYGAFIDANGASYADVDATLGRIRSLKPEAWSGEWRRTAQHYDRLGREAVQAGRSATAVEMLTRASTYYRFAEMSILSDTPERAALERAAVDAFVQAGRHMHPPIERVEVPVNGLLLPAYLRLPRGAARPPIVLIVPGLGMVKEHGDFPPEVIVDRGMATLTVDLPGQGESRPYLSLNESNAVAVVKGAVDYLLSREDLDGDRLALVGTSMGAAAAMLAAVSDRRVKALVEIAGFYNPSAWWGSFPHEIKEFLRYVLGVATHDELLEIVQSVNLRGRISDIVCPLLVVHGEMDPIIPFGESHLIFAEAREPKERLIFSSGDHGCVNVGEAHALIADWIASQLGA